MFKDHYGDLTAPEIDKLRLSDDPVAVQTIERLKSYITDPRRMKDIR